MRIVRVGEELFYFHHWDLHGPDSWLAILENEDGRIESAPSEEVQFVHKPPAANSVYEVLQADKRPDADAGPWTA